ncbi:MAG TPA: TadE family protein [Sphingomicrobium sp.]|nr:TadE family protein [Sphingomicrobium sp.]
MIAGSRLFALLRDRRGGGAVEFAMVIPLMLILIFGIIDAGRVLWEWNRAEKATQMGARYAIVTDVIPSAIVTNDYVGDPYCKDVNGVAQNCTPGDSVNDVNALGKLTCTSTGCTCATGGNCPSATIGTTAFSNLVTRMSAMKPDITAANVRVVFRGSGIGFAGDPNGMQVVPLVTVELTGLDFRPILLFNSVALNLPSFATTLSAESSLGTQSN